VKVTVTFASGFDDASVTFACSALPNAVPTAALCDVPATVTIACGAAAVLVNANAAGVNAPTDAVTL